MFIYSHVLPSAALALALSLCALRFMHYFQLNSYKHAEHIAFASRNLGIYLLSAVYALLALAALFLGKFAPAYLTLLCIMYAVSFKPKAKRLTKKPLVFTPRVKRMLITEAIVVAILTSLSFMFIPTLLLPAALAAALLICPWLCSIANLINAPIEKAIRDHYTNEAIALLRSHPSLKIIGITGSYGKTSTKYYLTTLLAEKYNVLMTPASYNTPMGVVKTVRAELKATTEVFVCEMGAKYVGDIDELCQLVRPDIGLLTSIAPQHLETFGSIENIAHTKLELCDFLAKNGGTAYVNLDSELIKKNLPAGCVSCGTESDADVRIANVRADENGTSFDLTFGDGTSLPISVQLLGAHNVTNLALAAATAYRMGLSPEEIRRGALKIRSAPHRLQLIKRGADILIDDAYNSNPTGAQAALDSLSLFSRYKVLVTPGMVELGDKSEYYNSMFGKNAAAVCDSIVLVGEKQTEPIKKGALEAGFPEERLHVCDRVEEALALAATLGDGQPKVILIENDLPDNY